MFLACVGRLCLRCRRRLQVLHQEKDQLMGQLQALQQEQAQSSSVAGLEMVSEPYSQLLAQVGAVVGLNCYQASALMWLHWVQAFAALWGGQVPPVVWEGGIGGNDAQLAQPAHHWKAGELVTRG